VRGSCKVKNAIIGGQLFGNVTAENKIELQSGSHVEGDLKTKRLVIDEGVFFEGNCSMGAGKPIGDKGAAAATPPTPASEPAPAGK
jgi:cytoskeletal protein CcmA (bactofilin family)